MKYVECLVIVDLQESKESRGRILAVILEAENLSSKGKGKILPGFHSSSIIAWLILPIIFIGYGFSYVINFDYI